MNELLKNIIVALVILTASISAGYVVGLWFIKETNKTIKLSIREYHNKFKMLDDESTNLIKKIQDIWIIVDDVNKLDTDKLKDIQILLEPLKSLYVYKKRRIEI